MSPEIRKLWFEGGEETDTKISELFKEDVEAAARGHLDHWL
jgi:uncharacterized protein (DUF924 family)